MWTSTLELSPRRVITTKLLGRIWPGAYFSSFAPFQVQNLPRQSLPAANWVRVRNRLAGVSGNDLRWIYVDSDFRIAPAATSERRFYPGHEVVGEVIEVGDEVQQLQVGDRVVLQHDPNCVIAGVEPICRSCAVGNYSLCERADLSGPKPFGGGWSEEMLLHEQQLFRISPEMSDEQAVLLEPSSVAVRAVLRRLPQADEHILITGAGTLGLLILQVVHALSPQTRISVLARYAFQVEQAMSLGATQILYPQDSYEGVQQATSAHLYKGMMGNKMLLGGYDVIYDTVGSKRTLSNALRWTRAGGTVVIVGLSLHPMRIDLTPIWYQEVDLIGTYGNGMETWPLGTHERRSTFAIAADMIVQGQLHPEKLITHRFALNNYRHALAAATGKAQSRAIKIVFDYSLLPASVVPNVRASSQQRQYLLSRPSSSGTPPITWQPVSPLSPMPAPTPTPSEDVPTSASPSAPIPPSEIVPPFILPNELQETHEVSQEQTDKNGSDTVIAAKSKYTRQRNRVQQPDNQLQEEIASESASNGEDSQSATTNDAPDSLQS
jgi:threonine dehydrogenase-like Zn-dependent dehydrogenase